MARVWEDCDPDKEADISSVTASRADTEQDWALEPHRALGKAPLDADRGVVTAGHSTSLRRKAPGKQRIHVLPIRVGKGAVNPRPASRPLRATPGAES